MEQCTSSARWVWLFPGSLTSFQCKSSKGYLLCSQQEKDTSEPSEADLRMYLYLSLSPLLCPVPLVPSWPRYSIKAPSTLSTFSHLSTHSSQSFEQRNSGACYWLLGYPGWYDDLAAAPIFGWFLFVFMDYPVVILIHWILMWLWAGYLISLGLCFPFYGWSYFLHRLVWGFILCFHYK